MQIQSVPGVARIEVRTFANGVVLPGAHVEISSPSRAPLRSTTDVNGEAAFKVQPGEWHIRVGLSGLKTAGGTVVVEENVGTIATANLASMEIGPVTIFECPDFWYVHTAARYTFYNNGDAWPAWSGFCP